MYVSTAYDDYCKKVSWIRNLTLKIMNQQRLDLMHVKMSMVKK